MNLIKDLLPPAITSWLIFIRRPLLGFTGPIKRWEDGLRQGYGYDNPKLLARQKIDNPLLQDLKKKLTGRQTRLAFAIATALQLQNAKKEPKVLDFGGADGAHFLLARSIFPHLDFNWTITEIPNVVDAYSEFGTENVTWKSDLPLEAFDIAIASSSIQYSKNATENLSLLLSSSEFLILDRLSSCPGPSNVIMKQNYWSPQTGFVSYPCWYFGEDFLIETIEKTHEIISTWDVPEDSPWVFGRRRPNLGLLARAKRKP